MRATRTDPLLSMVLHNVRRGGHAKLQRFYFLIGEKREKLTIEGDSLLWGMRVIVPRKLRQQVLQELHRGNSGTVCMKSLARNHVWWLHLDHDLEECAKECQACQVGKHALPKAPLHPWAWPAALWQCVHVEFAGPVRGKMLLLLINAHSKWPELLIIKSKTSGSTIEAL